MTTIKFRLAVCIVVALTFVSGATAQNGVRGSVDSLGLAIDDLSARFGDRYPRAAEFRRRLKTLSDAEPRNADWEGRFAKLQREALLANPLLDFDELLAVRRATTEPVPRPRNNKKNKNDKKNKRKNRKPGKVLGLPQNWQGNCALRPTGYRNEIVMWPADAAPDSEAQVLFQPPGKVFVGDVDLSFDGRRILFSMPKPDDPKHAWHLWELELGGDTPRQLTPDDAGVDHYDGCYLPDGRIIFGSTAGFQGVPCVGGGNAVANLYQMDGDGGNIRQLTYDQDHDWNPVVMNDGRVMYVRWEYTDIPHYFSRLLFAMNPDGTAQMALYGSNSYWPNSIFYPRPIPGEPSKVVAIVSGHHGVARMGELVVFDTAMGRHEAKGAVQRIPGHGKDVEPVITDQLVARSWPRFIHPFPVDAKNFLVSCQPRPDEPMGIWLVDVFDNMIPIRVEPGYALLEPILVRRKNGKNQGPQASSRPPAIPDRIDLKRTDADVFLSDVYAGKAMEGVPRGTVKRLRVFEYHYAYRKMGGHIQIGIDGPWDVRRVLGTVPVASDGSAHFTVPANTPIALQPLDADGRAVQIMRSWFTTQPGERLSCTGCHEDAGQAAAPRPTLAGAITPLPIDEWYGPTRGFSFKREVQPVLDRHCVTCHDGGEGGDKAAPNLRADQPKGKNETGNKKYAGRFEASYLALHPYVHRPGPESDSRVTVPGEYIADASELIQMLRKGHHGVTLDPESFERLVAWIDLNVPDHGTWGEQRKIAADYHQRRLDLRILYAKRPEDPEAIPAAATIKAPARRASEPKRSKTPKVDGWPVAKDSAGKMLGKALSIDLAPDVALDLLPVPAGRFVMGTPDGPPDEAQRAVEIKQGFHLGRYEITNRQFACFDPAHDSAFLSVFNKDVSSRGFPLNEPDQPVVRVSWDQANAFCRWLSTKSGRTFRLPTEEEWEWACRAGSDTAMNFGSIADNFAKDANLADRKFADLCRRDSPRWVLRIDSVNDGATGSAKVGRYQPNPWGLHDMHGNAAEWTSSVYRPGKFLPLAKGGPTWHVVRGGSFRDRPQRATSGFRYGYEPWLRPRDVGFRVVMEE